MKKSATTSILLGCITVITVVFVLGKKAAVYGMALDQLSVKPYHLEQTGFRMVEGIQSPILKYTIDRNSEGSHYRAQLALKGGSTNVPFDRVDMADGTIASLLPSIGLRATSHLSDNDLAVMKMRLTRQPPNCTYQGEKFEHVEEIAAQRADVVAHPSGPATRMLEWRLPSIGCDSVQTYLQEKASDSDVWHTTFGNQMVKYSEQEPDPKLFENWQLLHEATLTELKRGFYRSKGVTAATCVACFQEETEQDKRYYAGQR